MSRKVLFKEIRSEEVCFSGI